jgi:hypothetical protein
MSLESQALDTYFSEERDKVYLSTYYTFGCTKTISEVAYEP